MLLIGMSGERTLQNIISGKIKNKNKRNYGNQNNKTLNPLEKFMG